MPRIRLLTLCLLSALFVAADDAERERGGAKEALKSLQEFIGSWKRGVGQPKRGSTRGAWIEEADWAWRFEGNQAELAFKLKDGKYFSAGRVKAGDKPGEFRLVAILPDGKTQETYAGTLDDDGQLVLLAAEERDGRPARISLRLVAAGKRLLMLYERRIGETDRFSRLAEVGYTREGSGFGQGTTQRECVVTGGAGTIPVTYKGQTYYVCCTGCRDYFNDDPEAALAEYRERKAKEKQKAQKR